MASTLGRVPVRKFRSRLMETKDESREKDVGKLPVRSESEIWSIVKLPALPIVEGKEPAKLQPFMSKVSRPTRFPRLFGREPTIKLSWREIILSLRTVANSSPGNAPVRLFASYTVKKNISMRARILA